MANNSKQEVIVDGKRFEVEISIDADDIVIRQLGDTPVPNPDGGQVQPTDGVIKPGGWGASTDATTWSVTSMRNPPSEFKIVDNKGINVATNFKTGDAAQKFINYFKTHPFPPTPEPGPTPNPEPQPEPGPEPEPNPNPNPEPNPDPVPSDNVDRNGVILLVSKSGIIDYDVQVDKRPGKNDGIRYNFKPDGKKDWTQSEATGYFRFTKDPVDDEVSVKWSVVPHSGSSKVNCYDSGISIKNGKSRLRMELVHPEYSGALATGQGSPLPAGKWIGYKGTKTVSGDSVTIKLYQDTGDNETKPSNQWKEVFTHTDTKYKITGPHPYITLRIDDPKKQGQKNLEHKWLSVAKI